MELLFVMGVGFVIMFLILKNDNGNVNGSDTPSYVEHHREDTMKHLYEPLKELKIPEDMVDRVLKIVYGRLYGSFTQKLMVLPKETQLYLYELENNKQAYSMLLKDLASPILAADYIARLIKDNNVNEVFMDKKTKLKYAKKIYSLERGTSDTIERLENVVRENIFKFNKLHGYDRDDDYEDVGYITVCKCNTDKKMREISEDLEEADDEISRLSMIVYDFCKQDSYDNYLNRPTLEEYLNKLSVPGSNASNELRTLVKTVIERNGSFKNVRPFKDLSWFRGRNLKEYFHWRYHDGYEM